MATAVTLFFVFRRFQAEANPKRDVSGSTRFQVDTNVPHAACQALLLTIAGANPSAVRINRQLTMYRVSREVTDVLASGVLPVPAYNDRCYVAPKSHLKPMEGCPTNNFARSHQIHRHPSLKPQVNVEQNRITPNDSMHHGG